MRLAENWKLQKKKELAFFRDGYKGLSEDFNSMKGALQSIGTNGEKSTPVMPYERKSLKEGANMSGGTFLRVANIVIEEKFIGIGLQPDGIDLALPFVPDPRLQYVHGKYLRMSCKFLMPPPTVRSTRTCWTVFSTTSMIISLRSPDIDEVHPLYDSSPLNIQTGNDPLGKHCLPLCDLPLSCNN